MESMSKLHDGSVLYRLEIINNNFYSYPNYHNYMYYTTYNYPIYIFFLINVISEQHKKQSEHFHPLTSSKNHLSVPLLRVLTLRNS